jgi:acetyltransferase-like isoleucine patch superfamily enzyme
MSTIGDLYRRIKYNLKYKNNIKFTNYQVHIDNTAILNPDHTSRIEFAGKFSINRFVCIDIFENTVLKLGEFSYLGDFTIIRGNRCQIIIGKNVIVGQGVKLLATNHKYMDKSQLVHQQDIDVEKNGIEIEDDCWIGANALILPGVILAKGTVVGAGAVVTKSTQQYSVVAGNPAKFIKFRE